MHALLVTLIYDQLNVVMGSGVRPSHDNFCKHQMTFCNLNLHIPTPPVYSRKNWHYNRANNDAMTSPVTDFTWILPSKLNFSITKFLISQAILYLTTMSKFNLRILPGYTNNLRRMIKETK